MRTRPRNCDTRKILFKVLNNGMFLKQTYAHIAIEINFSISELCFVFSVKLVGHQWIILISSFQFELPATDIILFKRKQKAKLFYQLLTILKSVPNNIQDTENCFCSENCHERKTVSTENTDATTCLIIKKEPFLNSRFVSLIAF